MNQQFPIKNELAQKIWNHFVKELDHKIKVLPEEDRDDVKLELLSHLYESAINDEAENEENQLINAIERLGTPQEYLTPLISDILLSQQAKKGNPLAIAKSLAKTIQKSLAHTLTTIVFGVLYLFLIMIFIMSIAHFFYPEVGIWIHQSGSVSLSFEAQENSQQWLAQWFSVIGFVFSVIGYIVLNKLLYFILRNK